MLLVVVLFGHAEGDRRRKAQRMVLLKYPNANLSQQQRDNVYLLLSVESVIKWRSPFQVLELSLSTALVGGPHAAKAR